MITSAHVNILKLAENFGKLLVNHNFFTTMLKFLSIQYVLKLHISLVVIT